MSRVLLTTTSFQDTPGAHHDLLAKTGWEIVRARGPLTEQQMLDLVGDIDAFLCGDDAITQKVIDKALPKLKIISKYGIGLDKIDTDYATKCGIPVLFTPGVNHTTVAEHTFGLMISIFKHLPMHTSHTRKGEWVRKTGNEIMGKTIGIIGLGRIGKEVTIRAKAFGLKVIAYDIYWDEAFAKEYGVTRMATPADIFKEADIISLHANLNDETRDMINKDSIATMKKTAVIINCARGELVNTADICEALNSGNLGGYGTDVLDEEPPRKDHPMLTAKNCVVTPHIGSRTYESVLRQATKSVDNLILAMKGEKPLAQANNVPIPQPVK
jgi:D-3-phosphoglycerate dehydrogenase